MKKIDNETLNLLRCPVTGSKLQHATEQLVEQVNHRSQAGELCDRAGQKIDFRIDAALVNADLSLLMPIRAGVVSMAAGRSIELDKFTDSPKD